MNAHGQLTSAAAGCLSDQLKNQGYWVYYDHGPAAEFVGKIVVSYDENLTKKSEISQLDIAIIEKKSNKAIALIEIEESVSNQKTLIGDFFAVLIGNSIYCPGKKRVDVGEWTSLVVIRKASGHNDKNQHVLDMACNAKSVFGTNNCKIGRLVLESFNGKENLEKVLMDQIEIAIRRIT